MFRSANKLMKKLMKQILDESVPEDEERDFSYLIPHKNKTKKNKKKQLFHHVMNFYHREEKKQNEEIIFVNKQKLKHLFHQILMKSAELKAIHTKGNKI